MRFVRQRAVRWFSPGTVTGAGMRVLISSAFGAYLDKRELQAAIEAEPLEHRAEAVEMWMDFISDTGDGFNATYTVAWLAAQPQLTVAGHDRPLPRGDLVVMGGDEVYPAGDAEAYEHRFVGPYRASLPWTDGDSPELFALAGNHDWYDGLTAFVRIFCQKKWIGGRKTRQSRSYFAVALPHRWWLWGIDIQFDSYIDEPQLRYFEKVAPLMRAGDRVILCTAKPSWTDVNGEPGAFRNLAYVERRLIQPTGARLMLSLSGDSHHYAHYVGGDGTHKVTAGGGGAFLHPTHDLDDVVEIQGDPADENSRRPYSLTACWPDRKTSRGLSVRAAGLPFRNPSFMVMPGILYALLGWASQFSLLALGRRDQGAPLEDAAPNYGWFDLASGLGRNPISMLLILAFVGLLVAFAKPPHQWALGRPRLVAKVVMGLFHSALHLAAVVVVGLLAVRVVSSFADGGWFTFWLLVAMAVFGGIIGGFVTGIYLTVCILIPGVDAHGNEAFSSMRLSGYKNFLRLHFDVDGRLHVYPLGVRRAVKHWRLDPEAPSSEAPWLAPEGEAPAVALMEPAFSIDGRPVRA